MYRYVAFIGRIFVTNLFDKCIVWFASFFAAPIIYFLFFDKFNGLKSIVLLILIKSFLWDMYAMVLPSTEFATIIIASLILYYGYKLFYDTITSYMLLYTFSIKSTLRTWSTFSHWKEKKLRRFFNIIAQFTKAPSIYSAFYQWRRSQSAVRLWLLSA
jgi:hypothetical protein